MSELFDEARKRAQEESLEEEQLKKAKNSTQEALQSVEEKFKSQAELATAEVLLSLEPLFDEFRQGGGDVEVSSDWKDLFEYLDHGPGIKNGVALSVEIQFTFNEQVIGFRFLAAGFRHDGDDNVANFRHHSNDNFWNIRAYKKAGSHHWNHYGKSSNRKSREQIEDFLREQLLAFITEVIKSQQQEE